jgi:hypothetical protein
MVGVDMRKRPPVWADAVVSVLGQLLSSIQRVLGLRGSWGCQSVRPTSLALGSDLCRFYASIMADISYFEAWGMWLQGKSTLGNDLLGLPMIWWGRFGKILSFVSGAAVIVDLLGPERLSHYGDRLTRFLARRPVLVPAIAGAVTGGIWLTVTDMIGVHWLLQVALGLMLGGAAGLLAVRVSRTLRHPEFPSTTRWVSLGLFLIGFHFDLLAS